MQKIVPNIWCTRNAEEAGAFYADVFQNATSVVESRYPAEGLLEFQRELAGEPLTVSLTISGLEITLINAGSEFRPNPAISFMLNFDPLLFDGDEVTARASLDRIWARLSEHGTVLMDLGEYPFSEHYGWVEDRYGVSWQLILTDPAGEPRPFLMPALMFGGTAQNRAREAVDFYTSLFEDSALGGRVLYDTAQGPVQPGSVQYSEFRVVDQWFVAMDAGGEQAFTFTPGVSLQVNCTGQEEIDRLWNALSAVPEAEQCGWLVDRFGVSWQIVPQQMAELMQRPGAFEHMLEMKKLVIHEF